MWQVVFSKDDSATPASHLSSLPTKSGIYDPSLEYGWASDLLITNRIKQKEYNVT